ncbi:AAA family ATPase [Enorma phocaeensis]|uniref:AAA family ATPase n=1 Tax=Enorma phocaeensis TaxID=1871019 RepID=UPI00195E4E95
MTISFAYNTAKEDPALFLRCHRPPVLIDEIQKAPELLPYIKEIVDASDQTGTVWFTGSQPFHLMKQVSESLAGRVGIIEMLVLSGAEISGVPSETLFPGRDYFVRRVTASKPYDVVEAYDRIADIDEKTASPSRKDARNLNALDPVNAPDVVPELSMFKRKIGAGTIVCMAQETFPVSERA